MNLTAYSGSQPVRLGGRGGAPAGRSDRMVRGQGDNIQLDERLLVALPEKPQEVVRSLDPAGTVDFLRADVAREAGRADAPASAAGAEPLLDPLQQVSLIR